MVVIFDPSCTGNTCLPSGWVINGEFHDNSAACFWACLLSSVRNKYSSADLVVLRNISAGTLDPDWLNPEKHLQLTFEQMPGDTGAELQKAILDASLSGPPSSVGIKIHAKKEPLLSGMLPMDMIDEYSFMYLLAWLSTWAAIPRFLWDQNEAAGMFTATETDTGVTQDVSVHVTAKPCHEGLVERLVYIGFKA